MSREMQAKPRLVQLLLLLLLLLLRACVDP